MRSEPKKVCAACGRSKSTSEFYANSTAPDGFSARCKPCRRVQVARYREARKEYYKRYFQNLEKTEKRKQQRTRYRQEALADPERREKLARRVRSRRAILLLPQRSGAGGVPGNTELKVRIPPQSSRRFAKSTETSAFDAERKTLRLRRTTSSLCPWAAAIG